MPILHKISGHRSTRISYVAEWFSFGGLSPPNEKRLLSVLGVSAVRFLYWTGIFSRKGG
jgi:hypothetical protein